MEDITFLNKDANFCTKIGKDVFWVPVNTLGKKMYNIDEIADMLKKGECEKKRFRNLYDIIQLFFASGFSYAMDTKYVKQNNLEWELHQELSQVLSCCKGCCASVAAWMNYFLEGIYDDCGFFSFNRPDGTGHVMNYILHNNWYYLIDMTPYVINKEQKNFYETGNRTDYINSKNVTGILARCRSLREYSEFYNRIQMTKGYDFIYFKHKNDIIPPIAVETEKGMLNIIYPAGYGIECIYNRAEDKFRLKHVEYKDVRDETGVINC